MWELSFRDVSTSPGCYYSSEFSPFIYAKQWTIPSSIPVIVRHDMDPVISASLYTNGCSDAYIDSMNNKKCFGLSRKEQTIIGYVLISIGVVIVLIPIFVIMVMCKCCVSMKRGTTQPAPQASTLTSLSASPNPLQQPFDILSAQPVEYSQQPPIPSAQPVEYVQPVEYSQQPPIPSAQPVEYIPPNQYAWSNPYYTQAPY